MHELITKRRVEFSDTDQGGVVHFSRFFIFMETAEDQFLRALGSRFDFTHEGRQGGWPKVSATCEYLHSARYGDELEIRLAVLKLTRRTITYGFSIRRGDLELARGRTTSVCCAQKTDGSFEAIAIPAALAGRIEASPGAAE
ncbi:MAG TPA: thioesterase family protein [Candidatus Polarisedimenticolia bacterium]|nr:thioesterase family protein [Candidatus Polarisedimenticolia bacterium]